METMTIKTRKLEEDNATLKNHFEIMNKSLIEVAQEKTKEGRSMMQLQNICRVCFLS
jgi:hypothetical protein